MGDIFKHHDSLICIPCTYLRKRNIEQQRVCYTKMPSLLELSKINSINVLTFSNESFRRFKISSAILLRFPCSLN